MVALLHTGAELPRGAIKKISFPQEVMINADGSETSSRADLRSSVIIPGGTRI